VPEKPDRFIEARIVDYCNGMPTERVPAIVIDIWEWIGVKPNPSA